MLLALILSVHMMQIDRSRSDVAAVTWISLGYVLLAAIVVAMLRGTLVRLDPGALEVRFLWRRRRIPWSQITDVTTLRRGRLLRIAVGTRTSEPITLPISVGGARTREHIGHRRELIHKWWIALRGVDWRAPIG